MVVFPAERILFLVFVNSQYLFRRLQRWFLPVVLGWLLVAAVWEPAMVASLVHSHGVRAAIVDFGIGDVANSMIWLMVPVLLATWQYGYSGMRVILYVLVLEHAFLLPFLWRSGQALHGYILMSLTRIAMLTMLAYIVTHLVSALRTEHAALEQANRQLAQRAATVEQLAESRERNRLARDLHDTLAHSLTGLSVQLQALETLLEYDPQAVRQQLKEAEATVRSGVTEARRAIQALRAAPLEELGLAEALRQLCRRQAERTGTEFICDIGPVMALDPLTEQMIYRVAEEALTNVERHSAAGHVWVDLRMNSPAGVSQPGASHLCLEIRDDGVGFNPSLVPADSYGIVGMVERASLLGSSVRIESAPGRGTRLVLNVSVG
jgi:signal transduction histidine kinase